MSYGECVDLGGNRGPGFSGGTVSNYIVLESSTNVGDQCDGGGGGGPCDLDSKFIKVPFTGIGQTYYTDRVYYMTSMPTNWYGKEPDWIIKTPNDDRHNNTTSGYMKYQFLHDTFVYIAFDQRQWLLPPWAQGMEWTNSRIYTSLDSQFYMDVYYYGLFTPGQCIDLGGNIADPVETHNVSNYFILGIEYN
ncbi:MAG: hypothetical protein GY941_29475 [Planctomycetes bacterium]|nr:hypothetical protein [Planctomycetota bacterium]